MNEVYVMHYFETLHVLCIMFTFVYVLPIYRKVDGTLPNTHIWNGRNISNFGSFSVCDISIGNCCWSPEVAKTNGSVRSDKYCL